MAPTAPPTADELRQRAYEALAAGRLAATGSADGIDNHRLLHELQVHQVELELQNETLRQTQTDMAAAFEQLHELNLHLEDLVKARTSALATATVAAGVARNEAEAASRAKSTFLATMSHEIRTPLNAIMGFSQLLDKKLTDPQQRDWLYKVTGASKHLLAIVNNVLDFSKIEADQLLLASGDVDVRAIVGQVMALLEQPAHAKGLRLELQMGAVPAHCKGDATRLTQTLLNLASNAVKFTREGRVILRVTTQQEMPDAVLLRFEVQDTGVGVAVPLQGKLFHPFQQGDEASGELNTGTGLGLAITRRLAELMGGQANFQSTPDVGSTFWFTARLGCVALDSGVVKALSAGPDPTEVALRRRFSGARILLVEDEPMNQELARYRLEDVGMQVDAADDGAQAVQMVGAAGGSPYALVLMDMRMPRMDGVLATRALRQAGHQLPIIAMTANAFAEDRERCLAAGMNDFIAKPVHTDQLNAVLLKWLDQALPLHTAGT